MLISQSQLILELNHAFHPWNKPLKFWVVLLLPSDILTLWMLVCKDSWVRLESCFTLVFFFHVLTMYANVLNLIEDFSVIYGHFFTKRQRFQLLQRNYHIFSEERITCVEMMTCTHTAACLRAQFEYFTSAKTNQSTSWISDHFQIVEITYIKSINAKVFNTDVRY